MFGLTAPAAPVAALERPSVDVVFDDPLVLDEASWFEPRHPASTTPAPTEPSRLSARRRWIG
jgi:hypothetical protein